MVPYVEHAWGVDYAIGGVHTLCEAMMRVAQQRGATIRTNSEVTRILVNGDRSVGVELADGQRIDTDDVIVDADAAAALTHLLEDDISFRFRKPHLEHLRESCSTFMMYMGLDTTLDLRHHTFFFADDYEAEMTRLFRDNTLGDDLSVYVCNPSVTDPTVAPAGHSALYLLALAPNTRAPIDWDHECPVMRSRVLSALRRRTGIDVEPHIRAERIITPAEWESRYHISHGAVFGPVHSVTQLLALRLPNRLPSPSNVYITGAGTNPGSGVPTILESARIASRLLCESRGISFPAPRPLPPPLTWQRHAAPT
jgi:phytoene desaturase